MASFAEWTEEQKKKKKKKSAEGATFTEYTKQVLGRDDIESPLSEREDDIAPVRTTTKEEDDRKWFEKGAFEDGYQFGDVTKTILGSVTDIGENLGAGIIGLGEKAVDTLAFISPYVAQGQFYQNGGVYQPLEVQKTHEKMIQESKQGMSKFIAKDLYDEEKVARTIISSPVKAITGIDAEEDSVFGEKADSLAQSGGQLLATAGLQAVGIPWFVTSGVASFGSETESALNQGASMEEAGLSAAISAGAEILTEKISGGIKFGGKALDDALTKEIARGVSNKVVRTLAKLGLDMAGEGAEEVLSGTMSAIGQKITYADDQELSDLFSSEDALESFIGGAVLGGVGGGVQAIKAGRNGVDYTSGLTQNEEAVVNKVYEDMVAEAEKNGKVTQAQKSKIYNEVLEQMDKGYISTDTIEEVLGGETYKTYKDTIDSEDALQAEFDALNKMKQGDMTGEQIDRRSELKQQLKDLENTSQRNQLKTQLSDEVYGLAKDSRLAESYNERARRSQAFEADLTQYDAKQQQTIQKAIDSGILNNTNRTHEFVDLISKISADKGVLFDFTNNQKLKDSGFAVDGKTVNGYVTKDGVTLNIDSTKSLNSVTGHEITHILEGTELYAELQNTLFEYAKSKGEYDSRLASLTELYKNVKDADVNAELTADLVGDYLFTDADFIRRLSMENRNIFQKIYDEIKYLCKVATAGSKEARELEKVKKAFEDAYRADSIASGDTKYSISDKNIKDVSTGYAYDETYFTMSYTQDGKEVATLEYGEYNGKPNVKMIEVDPEYRRKGIATKLLQELQKKYPDTEIDFGMTTTDGTKLLDSITYGVTDEAVVADRQKLKDLQTELNELQGKLDVLYDTENLTEAQEAEMHSLGDRWTEVYDSIRQLEQNLRGKKATKTFVKTDAKYYPSDSNGRQLTKEQQDYFKDSKVRDENGNLKVMYHGTSKGGHTVFDTYGSNYGLFGQGSYFTDNRDIAESYTKKGKGNHPKVYETYLNITNPMDMDGEANPAEWQNAFPDADFPKTGTNEEFYRAMEEYLEDEMLPKWEAAESAINAIQGMGYDGITHIGGGRVNPNGERHQVYIAFDPEQIKNTDNTKPTTDPDIRYSISGVNAKTANSSMLLRADHLLNAGADSETVRQETGWYKGYDGKMRFEIDDSKSELIENPDLEKHEGDGATYFTGKLSDILKHNELYEAYPQLRNVNIVIQPTETGTRGIYQPNSNYITLSLELFKRHTKEYEAYLNGGRLAEIERIEQTPEYKEYNKWYEDDELAEKLSPEEWLVGEKAAQDKFFSSELGKKYYQLKWGNPPVQTTEFGWGKEAREVLIHEIQHAVQKIENFARGSSPGYWRRVLDAGDTIQTAEQKAELREAEDKLYAVYKQNPEFYTEMTDLLATAPDMPRGKVDWDTLEQIEEDPIEWQEFDKNRDALEEKYGTMEVFDFFDLYHDVERFKERSLTADDAYYSTAGEIEARDTANRLNLDAEQRRNKRPDIDNKRVVFADVLYSLSEETDKTYLDAVNRGDTDTAQKMVNEAAQNAGYTIKAYHGSPARFTVFDKNRVGKGTDQFGAGFYFGTTDEISKAYGGEQYEVYLDIKNPVKVYRTADGGDLYDVEITPSQAYKILKKHPKMYDAEESPLGDWYDTYWETGTKEWMVRELANNYTTIGLLDGDLFRDYPNELHEAIRDVLGYDGVEVSFDNTDSKFYVAWFDNQMKSADPVVRDDEGNVIPLSERFNHNKNDIRYSISDNGQKHKQYGNYNVFAKDIMLDKGDIAPVEEVTPVSQTETAVETAKTEQNVPITGNVPLSTDGLAEIAKNARREEFRGAYTHNGKQYLSDGSFIAEFNTVDETLEQSKDFPAKRALKELDEAYERQIPGNYDLHTATDGYVKVGNFLYDAKYVNALIRAIENPVFSLSNVRGGDNALLVSGDNGRALLMPVRAGGNVSVAYEAQPVGETAAEMFPDDLSPVQTELDKLNQQKEALESRMLEAVNSEDLDTFYQINTEYESVMSRIEELEDEISESESDRVNSLTDADIPPEMDAPYYGTADNTRVENPFGDRNWYEVGKRNVKAYMYENPEVKPFFQEEALHMMGELRDTTKGERFYDDQVYYESGGEKGITGVKRHTSASLEEVLDSWHMSYADIEKGLTAIIEDNGAENIAAAKKLEFMLNDRLLNGYQDFYTNKRVPPNQDYINLLNEKQINEYSKEAFDSFMATADQYAPVAEETTEDIAPVPRTKTGAEAPVVVNPHDSVGAAPYGFDPITELQYKYGNLPDGEHPVREDSMPKSTNGKDRVSLTARTVKGAEATPDELVDLLDKETVGGLFSYIPIKNSSTVQKAYNEIVKKGWEAARGEWEAKVRRGEVSAEMTATGALLLNNAAKAGDRNAWLSVLHDYQIMGTNAGQAVQAMRILKTLSPDDSLYMIERSVNQMVNDMKLGTEFVIDENLKQKYLDAKTDGERDAALDALAEDIARQIPSTAMDKWTALRYLNMLGNLRTQGRNILGNTGMSVTSRVKNIVATGIEWFAEKASGGKFHRTKSLFVGKDLLKAAKNDFAYVESIALNGGKFNDSMAQSLQFQQKVQDARKIFKFAPLEGYRRATNWAMEKGDLVFSKAAYGRALAGYLKANGITETDFSKIDQQVLDEARAYAIKEAQETTFRDNNWLSDWISKVGRRKDTPKVGKLISEGVMPFRKTPANILFRAEEYSPLGIVNATVKSIQAAKGAENVTGADVVNSWAKTFTGTGLFALGVLLNNSGVLSGGPDEDDDKEWFENQYGWQNYAIQIGDYNYTIDFLSPAAMPLLMGAQLNELRQSGGVELKDLETALLSIADPMIEMSMLQGVNDTLDNIRYAESNMGQFLVNAGLSYLTQGLTNSFLGQVERSVEGQRMTTYVDKNSTTPEWLQKALGKASAKTPGWDYQQIPYVDAWGETEDIAPLPALAENALSPSYVEQGISDNVYEELNRLNDAQSDVNVYPQTPSKTVTFDDAYGNRHENYKLSAEEYVELAQLQGQTQKELVEDILSSYLYSGLTDQEKAKAVQLAYQYAREYSRQEVLGADGFSSKWMAEADDIVNAIISHTNKEMTFAYDNPEKYAFFKENDMYEAYSTASEEDKRAYNWAYENPGKYTMSKVISDDLLTFYGYKRKINEIKANHTGKGEKDKVVNHIFTNLDLDYGQKIILIRSMYESKADKEEYNYDIVEYLNSRNDISHDEMVTILKELDCTVHSDGTVTWD